MAGSAYGQERDTIPTSVDPELEAILSSRNPKEYIIAGVTVTGTKRYDEQLLISIAGFNIGDKVLIPGGDNFSKAINNLWKQRLFSNVQIYFTKLEGSNLFLEIHVTEMPTLSKFFIKGVRKSDEDELKPKTDLVVGKVVTENVKRNAVDAVQKYFTEKRKPWRRCRDPVYSRSFTPQLRYPYTHCNQGKQSAYRRCKLLWERRSG